MKAHLIGIEGNFLNEYVDEIVRLMGHVYPEIVENRELERRLITAEEDRFGSTLRQGRAFLEEELKALDGKVWQEKKLLRFMIPMGSPLRSQAKFVLMRA